MAGHISPMKLPTMLSLCLLKSSIDLVTVNTKKAENESCSLRISESKIGNFGGFGRAFQGKQPNTA